MEILHVGTKSRTHLNNWNYRHTRTYGNNILNEQTQFKLHVVFEHIIEHTHKRTHSNDLSTNLNIKSNNETDSAPSDRIWRSHNERKLAKAKVIFF